MYESMRGWLAVPLLALAMSVAAADPAVGRWKTIDDETGQPKSIVEISEAPDGTLTGKVVQVLQSDQGPHPVCDQCKGQRRNQPIEGMTILWGLKRNGMQWSGGSILDPANGKTYKSKLTVVDGGKKLDVRGFIGIEALGRTQTWVRE